MSTLNSIQLLGVNIHLVTVEGILDQMDAILATHKRSVISHVHVMALNLAYEHTWFRDFLNQSSLVYCDGMGVRLGARLLGMPAIPERTTLADWMEQLAEFAAQRRYSLFFLGNPPGSADRAADKLSQRYPELKIVGTHHGFFDKSLNSTASKQVLDQIQHSRPDILMVGFGMPAQEKWIEENWDRIAARLIIPCGAIFEYVAGDLKRGPQWMTGHYLEWLARVIISPHRYWKRYLVDNPKFFARLLRQKMVGTLPES
jgi:N-acetylglucosaminyldiphosphoundecaprenol N-acetyl-beta-D-mannosaminyltransferase